MYPNPQDALPFPPRPNLGQYKKQAKDLVKACKSGDDDAIRNWTAEWLVSLAALQGVSITPQLRTRLERQVDQIAPFARARLSNSRSGSAQCALAEAQFIIARVHGFESWPKFAKHIEAVTRATSSVSDFEAAADAIVAGDVSTLELLLRENSELVRARSTREHRATLLHYVSANGVENYRQKTPTNAVEVAEILLNAGAEVDAEADVYGDGDTTLALVATSIHPERAGVQIALLKTLLDHRATIDAGVGGVVVACLHNGRPLAAEFLASRGAHLDLEGAAGVGRLDIVKSFFKEDKVSSGSEQARYKLISGATESQLKAGFIWACEYGRLSVVEFLLGTGVDLRAGENCGQTALHLAAHRGQLDIINLLLSLGAPLEAKNVYGGTVLGQATWSVMNGGPGIDWVPIIETLIAAGARVEEANYPTGNERVDEVLWRYGAKGREP